MQIALGVALGSIMLAPFIGRWRANCWLRRHFAAAEEQARVRPTLPSRRSNVVEIA